MALKFLLFQVLPDQLWADFSPSTVSLNGRTYIITGSNTGIGLALALHIARLNPSKLILAVRDLNKGNAAKEKILHETGVGEGVVEVWELDMADFGSVMRFAETANKTLERLDGAVLNAGIHAGGWEVTVDGWERTLQVNVLATGLLGVLLLPLLQSTSRLPPLDSDSTLNSSPRLTITGSGGLFMSQFPQKTAEDILRALNDQAQDSIPRDRYNTTKLLDLFIARGLAKLDKADGVVVNVVDPGMCDSDLARELNMKPVVMSILRWLAWPTSKGALNLLFAVIPSAKEIPSGSYISKCEVTSPSAWSLSQEGLEVQSKVWAEMVSVWKEVAPEVAGI